MEQYITTSEKVKQIIKGLELTRGLFVSSVIIGERHTGKKSLLRYLFPDTPVVSGSDQDAVEAALSQNDELIICNFEKLKNYETLDFDGKRIIATADYMGNKKSIDKLFAFIYTMPPLAERPEDIRLLKEIFLSRAKEELMLKDVQCNADDCTTDLSQNAKSLKSRVYRDLIIHTMSRDDLYTGIYRYLLERIDGNNAYREYLDIYEKPLIEAGLAKYGSQLKLSSVLGINRNTLRKKIYEHGIN